MKTAERTLRATATLWALCLFVAACTTGDSDDDTAEATTTTTTAAPEPDYLGTDQRAIDRSDSGHTP